MLEMRELRGDDLFTLLPLIGKLDIKDELVDMFGGQDSENEDGSEVNAELVGMRVMANIIQTVMVHIKDVKVELNGLLADLTGSTVAEIGELGFGDYTSLIVNFFKKPELADFLKSIASSMQ